MHIDGYEHQDRAELEAQLCRANARAEAAEQHARELEHNCALAVGQNESLIKATGAETYEVARAKIAAAEAENAALREKLAVAVAALRMIRGWDALVSGDSIPPFGGDAPVFRKLIDETLKKLGVE